MVDAHSNIRIDIDTSNAYAQLRALQAQLSSFYQTMNQGTAAQAKKAQMLQASLLGSVNALKDANGYRQFAARQVAVTSSTERFTRALEGNKLTMREYFRYGVGATKTFGKVFAQEHAMMQKVARERVKTLQTQYIKLGRDASGALQAIKVRPLRLDMKDLATQTAINAQRQQLFNQLLKQGSTSLLNFGKNTQWAGRQLMVGFTLPLAYLGSFAAKTFMDMEKQAIRFKRVYGELFTTQAETDQMIEQINELASAFTKYGVAAEKTMGLAADAAAMGKMGADLLAQVNQATRLAVLGGVEQEQALETTISLTNAFGIASDQLAGKIDFLNAVENQTVTSIEDLTIAIPKAGPVIQQLGGDVEDLAFFLTAMKEGGINASEGANALKSGLASLINPTAKASKMLEEMGINIKGIVENNAGDVKSLVIEFAKALNDLDPLARARAIEQLFGKFQFARLSTLFKNVTDDANQANRVLKLTNASAAELAVLSERELKRVEASPMYKFKKAVEDLKVSLIPLGETFIKLVTPLVDFAKNLLDNFNKMDSGAKTFVTGLIAVLGGIAPVLLMSLGLIANGVANLIKFFGFLGRTFQGASAGNKELGLSTAYMTQEQLEAQAVANALDGNHRKLIATFNAEKTSIDALTASYQKAAAAAQRFSGAGRIKSSISRSAPKVQGFADGGFVPGTGNQDTVPAMLTPGEYIATQEQVKENPRLFAALSSGVKINNWNQAKGTRSKSFTSEKFKEFTFGSKSAITEANKRYKILETAIKEQSGQTKLSAENTKLLNKTMNEVLSASKGKDGIVRVANIEKAFASNATAQLATSIAKSVESATQQKQTGRPKGTRGNFGIVEAHTTSSKTISVAEQEKLLKELKKQNLDESSLATNLKKSIAKGSAIRGYNNLTMTMPAVGNKGQLTGQELSKWISENKSMSMRQITNTLGLTPAQEKAFADKIQKELGQEKNSTTRITEKAFAQITAKAVSSMDDDDFKKKWAEASKKIGTFQFGAGIAGKAATRQEMPATFKDTKDKKYGGSSYLRDARTIDRVPLHKKADDFVRRMFGIRLTGKAPTTAAPKSETKPKPTKPVKDTASKKQTAQPSPRGKQTIFGKEDKAGKTRYYQNGKQVSQKAYEEEQKRLARNARQREQYAAKQRAQQQMADDGVIPKSRMTGQMFANRAGAVAGGASLAAMGLSMTGGSVGEMAGQAMMPLMMLSMIIPMLASKTGLVVAGLAAVVGAFIYLKSRLDDATKSGIQLGKALTMNNSKLEQMAEFTGKATASQIADKQRSMDLNGRSSVNRKFGQTYMESDAGKALITDAETMSKSGMNNQQIANNFANQLSYAILQGAVTADQARSIAAQLGTELKNHTISTNIMAQITQLYGPNGENLTQGSPLEISLNVQKRSMQEQTQAFENAMSVVNENSYNDLQNSSLAIVAAGATIAGIGAALAPATFGVSAAVGVIAGGITAAVGGIIAGVSALNEIGDEEENNKARAVAVQYGAEQLAQNQGLLDSLSYQYDQQIAALEVEKKSAKTKKQIKEIEDQIVAKQEEKNLAIQKQKQANSDVYDNLIKQSQIMGGAFNSAINTAIDEKYKDASGALKSAVELAKNQLNGLQDSTFKATLQLGLASGELDPNVISSLITANTESGGQLETTFNAVLKTQGSAEANQLMQLLLSSGVKTQNIQVMLEYFNKSKDFDGDMDALSQLNSMKSAWGLEVDLNVNGADKIKAVSQFMNETKNLPDKISFDVLTNYKNNTNLSPDVQKTIDGILNNWETLAGGKKKKIDYQVVVDFATGEVSESDIMALYLAENPLTPRSADRIDNQSIRDRAKAWFFGADRNGGDTGGKTGGDEDGDGTSGTKKADPYFDLLKRLKEVRDAAINASGGFKELNRVIGKGNKLRIFDGMEQQLRKAGATAEFIQKILGMEKSERKKFIKKDSSGNFVMTKIGRQFNAGLNEVKIGESQSAAQQQIQDIKNQATAFRKLAAAGLSVEDSYELIKDEQLAAAIVQNMTTKELEKYLKVQKKLTKAQERAAALEQVRKDIAAFDNEIKLKNKLTGFTLLEKEAILNDETLKAMVTLGQTGAEEFKKRLAQILSDVDFLQGIFDKGFSNVQEAFSVQEQQLRKAFDAALVSGDLGKFTFFEQFGLDELSKMIGMSEDAIKSLISIKDPVKIIEIATQQIATLNYEIDDLNAELELLSYKEEEINKKYDKRIEALDKILEANNRISEAQKSQISIADALTRGDISAAAQALQDRKKQQASDAVANQKELLERSRKLELDNLIAQNGLTREQIEKRIRDLQKEILIIEETRLEPAQRVVELSQLLFDKQLSYQTVLGKTKEAWDNIKLSVDAAKVASAEFVAEMEAALVAASALISAYGGTSTYTPTTTTGTSSGGGGTTLTGGLKYMSAGGEVGGMFKSLGTDTVPAMLTPGEFVVRKYAVDKFGLDRLEAINNGNYSEGSVYNSYSVNVNVDRVNANASDIARTVINEIRRIDSQRIRGNRI